jgi:hypothetical protein
VVRTKGKPRCQVALGWPGVCRLPLDLHVPSNRPWLPSSTRMANPARTSPKL